MGSSIQRQRKCKRIRELAEGHGAGIQGCNTGLGQKNWARLWLPMWNPSDISGRRVQWVAENTGRSPALTNSCERMAGSKIKFEFLQLPQRDNYWTVIRRHCKPGKRVRRDFFGSPILLRRYGLAHLPMGVIFKPQGIRKTRGDTLLQENVAVPYLELGSKFNFSIWVTEDYLIMSGKLVEIHFCAYGRLITGNVEIPPLHVRDYADSDDRARLYNIFWRQVESIRVMYVTEISVASHPLHLTHTRASFLMQLWLLTALTMTAMTVVLVRRFKSWRMGWLLAFYIIGTLMVQGQTLSKRAKHISSSGPLLPSSSRAITRPCCRVS